MSIYGVKGYYNYQWIPSDSIPTPKHNIFFKATGLFPTQPSSIVWKLYFNPLFNIFFSYIGVGRDSIHPFLEFFLPVLFTIFFQSYWLLFYSTINETMDSSERGMNPVAMIIINSQEKYWPSSEWDKQPPVLKFCTFIV